MQQYDWIRATAKRIAPRRAPTSLAAAARRSRQLELRRRTQDGAGDRHKIARWIAASDEAADSSRQRCVSGKAELLAADFSSCMYRVQHTDRILLPASRRKTARRDDARGGSTVSKIYARECLGCARLCSGRACTDRGESSREPTQRLPSWRQPVAAAPGTASLCTRLSNRVD
ncbi:hypothetical protein L917_06156 [Phytophthora nicotianae]|uniref:Uncharacterized protein n=2 Tax=Phytophthora nicotianae TaxID=4792 RepID=W2LHY4_PHYNI|nr:hypothetical protein L917_06156 [Phytophthora nicotianae]ETO78550.1 hypothetical protein F444_06534 [Phytophthora nicotianae P1976]